MITRCLPDTTGPKTHIIKITVLIVTYRGHRQSPEGSWSPVLESILGIVRLIGLSSPLLDPKGKYLESLLSAISDKTSKKLLLETWVKSHPAQSFLNLTNLRPISSPLPLSDISKNLQLRTYFPKKTNKIQTITYQALKSRPVIEPEKLKELITQP